MLAMRMMLPPFPNRTICRPAACEVNREPQAFTSITCRAIGTPNQPQLYFAGYMGGDGKYLLEQLFSLVHGWDVDSSANPCNCGAHVHPPLPVANHLSDFPHRFL